MSIIAMRKKRQVESAVVGRLTADSTVVESHIFAFSKALVLGFVLSTQLELICSPK